MTDLFFPSQPQSLRFRAQHFDLRRSDPQHSGTPSWWPLSAGHVADKRRDDGKASAAQSSAIVRLPCADEEKPQQKAADGVGAESQPTMEVPMLSGSLVHKFCVP